MGLSCRCHLTANSYIFLNILKTEKFNQLATEKAPQNFPMAIKIQRNIRVKEYKR
jgi:hypothetical protein